MDTNRTSKIASSVKGIFSDIKGIIIVIILMVGLITSTVSNRNKSKEIIAIKEDNKALQAQVDKKPNEVIKLVRIHIPAKERPPVIIEPINYPEVIDNKLESLKIIEKVVYKDNLVGVQHTAKTGLGVSFQRRLLGGIFIGVLYEKGNVGPKISCNF